MLGRVKLSIVLVAIFAASFFTNASPANASATKCSGPFCVMVKGSGTHLTSIQYTITVRRNDAVNVAFDWTASDPKTRKKIVERITGYYKWSNKGSLVARTFTSRLYTVNRNFPNGTTLEISSFQTGNSSYYARDIDNIVIHK